MSPRNTHDDDAAFDEFVTAVWRRLHWSAYMLTGDAYLAEDLAQTALVKTYVVWPKVRRADALAYARRVLVNANIDRLRRRHLTEVSRDVQVSDTPHSEFEDRDQLVRLLAGLTQQERKVLVLRHYFDLPENEVADELGVSVGTVKSTASKARAKLREGAGRQGATRLRGVG